MFKNLSAESLGISARDSEFVELVLSNGFKGVDLDLVDFAAQVKSQGVAKASRLIVSARLKIGSFPLPVRWEEDEAQCKADLQTLPELAEIVAQLGCTRATTLIEPSSDRRPYHENFEYHRHRLAEVAGVLAAHKIRLGVGFLAPLECRAGRAFQFMQTFDEVMLLLRSVAAPNVGLALDTWHWHLGGGKLDTLRTLAADKIVTVSLADADADTVAATARIESRRLGIAPSVIDQAAVLTALAEMKYDGPVTPAPDKSQLAGQGRSAGVKQIAAALDTIWKSAGLNNVGRLTAVPGR